LTAGAGGPILSGMRTLIIALVASLAVPLLAASAAAQGRAPATPNDPLLGLRPGESPIENLDSQLSDAGQLEELFQTLATTDDPRLAQRTASRINRIWMASGSDTVDLLMQWSLEAIEAEDIPLALDLLDRVVTLAPRYIEGWNKRATVLFMADEYGKSLADLERVLALEPRHFQALSGLGTILRAVGEKESAIEVYRRALQIDPHLETVRDALVELEAEVNGRQA